MIRSVGIGRLTSNQTEETPNGSNPMNLEDYLKQVKKEKPIEGGYKANPSMHEIAHEALRTTAELNGSYHHPAKIRALRSALIRKPVDETFAMFPPFSAAFGKNISIGRN